MTKFVDGHSVGPIARARKTLEELREIALAHGCTPAQFARAVDVLGGNANPDFVARYLKRHAFVPASFDVPMA
jgi:hypothetical protein